MMDSSRKTLVVCMLGRMGDLIAVEPVLREVVHSHADCRKVWYTTPAFSAIYRNAPFFDEIIEVSGPEEYRAQKANFPQDAILYEFNLKGQPPLPGRAGSQFPLLYGLTRNCAVKPSDEIPCFYLDDSASIPVRLPERYAIFHCTSNGRRRQYPVERWNRLATICMERGVAVVEVGLHPILTCPGVIRHTGKQDLQVIAKMMQKASMFIGMESGFAHMANAFHVFGVIIAGKLKNYPDYNPYTGYYAPEGNGCNMVRFYDEFPIALPVALPEKVLLRVLDGHPMKYAECESFCLHEQISRLHHNFALRLCRLLAAPFCALKLSLLAHRNKHR